MKWGTRLSEVLDEDICIAMCIGKGCSKKLSFNPSSLEYLVKFNRADGTTFKDSLDAMNFYNSNGEER